VRDSFHHRLPEAAVGSVVGSVLSDRSDQLEVRLDVSSAIEASTEMAETTEGEVEPEEDDDWESQRLNNDADDLTLLARQHSSEDVDHPRPGYDGNDASMDGSMSEGSTTTRAGRPTSKARVSRVFGADNEGTEEGFVTVRVENNMRTEKSENYSLLEKLWALRSVKMFRFIPQEYLPAVAKVCDTLFVPAGEYVCQLGEATDQKLYIIKDGSIGLIKDSAKIAALADGKGPGNGSIQQQLHGVPGRSMRAGDTFGNTSLLLNTTWKYSAVALEHTNLLTIDRRDLTDVLRGRRELAAAVIKGLYKTFTRRMKLVERMRR
jgi:CRP-like cAMP-binding protein